MRGPDELDERSRATVERLIDRHHWLCAIAPTRRAVKLVLHKGALLADPRGVMEGEGRYVRAIAFRSPEEVDAAVVAPILREAAARQTEV